MEEIKVLSCLRGYHVHKDVWTAAVRETLVCQYSVKTVNSYKIIV